MNCPQCRAENPADSNYCAKCGGALAEADAPAPRRLDRDALVKREIALLLAGIVLLLGAAVGTWYALFYHRSPEMIVRRFIEADRAGNFTQEEGLVSNRTDSRLFYSTFQTVRQQAGSSPFQKYRITGASISGNTAYVNVDITVPQPSLPGAVAPLPGGANPAPGSKLPVTFLLVREDNEWKIDAGQTLVSVTGSLLAWTGMQLNPSLLPNAMPPGLPGLPGLTPRNPGSSAPSPAPSPPPAGSSSIQPL